MGRADYFAVGPRFVLCADGGSADVSPLRLRVAGPEHRTWGWAMAAEETDGLRLHAEPEGATPGDESGETEVVRLLARVALHASAYRLPLLARAGATRPALARALAADGFTHAGGGEWRRPPHKFVRPAADKARSMDGVYSDPFTVPWNFVPREWDVLEAVAAWGAGSGERILDLGCGYGKNATALEELGFQVFGVELAPTAVARCRELVAAPHRYVVGSALGLPWREGWFDAVLDVGCLHCLVEGRAAAVSEIARVLRPGGVLFSRTFKPRDPRWLAEQPFATDAFGLADTEAAALFRGCFRVDVWRPDANMNYLRCTRAA